MSSNLVTYNICDYDKRHLRKNRVSYQSMVAIASRGNHYDSLRFYNLGIPHCQLLHIRPMVRFSDTTIGNHWSSAEPLLTQLLRTPRMDYTRRDSRYYHRYYPHVQHTSLRGYDAHTIRMLASISWMCNDGYGQGSSTLRSTRCRLGNILCHSDDYS